MGWTIDFLSKEEAEKDREREFQLELARINSKARIPSNIYGIDINNIWKLKMRAYMLGYNDANKYIEDICDEVVEDE